VSKRTDAPLSQRAVEGVAQVEEPGERGGAPPERDIKPDQLPETSLPGSRLWRRVGVHAHANTAGKDMPAFRADAKIVARCELAHKLLADFEGILSFKPFEARLYRSR
jgi:hypothetical protein